MKYRVMLRETVTYTIDLEADDEALARELAHDMWADSDDPTREFSGQGEGVEIDDVEVMGK